MSTPSVELITCEDGDWEVLLIDKKEFVNYDWIALINKITGIKEKTKEISNEDMEDGNY